MNRTPLPILLLFVFWSATSLHADQIDDQFDRWDQNQDDQLTKEELPPNAQRNFERVDENKNQKISREEHRQFLTQRPQAQPRNLQGQNRPEKIVFHSDIPYADTDNPRQRLDLLLPGNPENDKPLPVVVFIHGGAWQGGNKRGGIGQLRGFVQSGKFAGVSVGYRLSGEAIWPAQIHDCKAAIRWIRANAEKYNLDPDRIGVMGSSAGGHLVLMLGTSGGVEELEGQLGPHTKFSSQVTCVVNLFGPSNLPTMGNHNSRIDHNSPNAPEARLIGGAVPENLDKAKAASPITHVSPDDPPFLHIHGLEDPVVPYQQAEEIHAALQQAEVPTELILIKQGGHGGFPAEEYIPQITAFLEKHLLEEE